MSISSLYYSCQRKICINLQGGMYKSYQQNPFSTLPLEVVDDLMSAALDLLRVDALHADDLEQLLICGRLRKLKISRIHSNSTLIQTNKVLNFLKYGCQKLEILNLAGTWIDISAIDLNDHEYLGLLFLLMKSLVTVLGNSLNLKDFHSCIPVPLKALRICKKLRRLRLHFQPYEDWCNFLAIRRGYVQIHECLEFFTICMPGNLQNIPHKDLVLILQHCPVLLSLGFTELSGSLSELSKMGISPSLLKLRQCFWRVRRIYDSLGNPIPPSDDKIHEIKEAALYYPMVEELDIECSSYECIPSLRNFQNLNFLSVTCGKVISSVSFKDILIEIGSQLKHLSFHSELPTDISIILDICPNLESLRIQGYRFTEFAYPNVKLSKLKRLTIKSIEQSGGQVLSLFSNCDRLTELFLRPASYLDDDALKEFLNKNCLSDLRVAYFEHCKVTDLGFKHLLQNSPQLERITITDMHNNFYNGPLFEMNNKVLHIDTRLSEEEEFFWKRYRIFNCKEN